jgi:hypothetical protein
MTYETRKKFHTPYLSRVSTPSTNTKNASTPSNPPSQPEPCPSGCYIPGENTFPISPPVSPPKSCETKLGELTLALAGIIQDFDERLIEQETQIRLLEQELKKLGHRLAQLSLSENSRGP